MRAITRRTLALLFVVSVGAVGACSLNPQPIPPGFDDNNGPSGGGSAKGDASVATDPTTNGGDAGSGASPDGATRVDDAAADSAPPSPFVDAALDGDADGAVADASDATTD